MLLKHCITLHKLKNLEFSQFQTVLSKLFSTLLKQVTTFDSNDSEGSKPPLHWAKSICQIHSEWVYFQVFFFFFSLYFLQSHSDREVQEYNQVKLNQLFSYVRAAKQIMNHSITIGLFLRFESVYHKTTFKKRTVVHLFWKHSAIKALREKPSVTVRK